VEAGRAVLCDKPFGRSAAESGAMVDAADQAKVLNFVNFEFRFEPARIHLKQIIDEGAIGTPEHLHWTAWNSAWRTPSRPFGWQFDQTAGGGWIGAWGSHAVDAIRWLLGDVTGAGAHTRIVVSERPDADGALHRCDAEDGFTAWLELSSGSTATIDASSTAAAPLPPRVVISGSEGVVEITNDRRVVLRRPDGGREESDLGGRSGDPHLLPMLRWAEAIRESITEGHQVSPSFADGLACAQVLDAFRSGPAGVSPGR
jgi:predicted dehydrogenase